MEMDELKESNSRGNDSKRSRKEEKNGLAVLFFFEPEMLQPWPRLIPGSVQTAPRGPSRHSL